MRKTRKNAQGAGTIRKRADGRWEARFTTGFDPASGKPVQKSIYGRTQKEITAFLKAIEGCKYELVYRVTLFTGMRQGEILGLT